MIQKFSRQRQAVYDELSARTDHPTADMLFAAVREFYPSISLATVYRNLNLLVSEGKAQKITVDGADHFDANSLCHYHLTCVKCGRVVDLDFPVIESLTRQVQESCGEEIFSHNIMFNGLCCSCK